MVENANDRGGATVVRTVLAAAFAGAAVHVLQEMLDTEVAVSAASVEQSPVHAQDVTVMVGLTGEVNGLSLLTMPTATALAVAGRLMGEPVTELDEIGLSAVAELGNMVSGAATVKLEEKGVSANITPPSVIQSRSPEITAPHQEWVIISLQTGFGAIALHVSVRS